MRRELQVPARFQGRNLRPCPQHVFPFFQRQLEHKVLGKAVAIHLFIESLQLDPKQLRQVPVEHHAMAAEHEYLRFDDFQWNQSFLGGDMIEPCRFDACSLSRSLRSASRRKSRFLPASMRSSSNGISR